MITNLNKDTFKQTITQNKYSVVKFGSNWCGPCKMLSNTLKQFDIENNIPIYEVDVDSNVELCNEYDITNIPVLMVFDSNCNIMCRYNRVLTQGELEFEIFKKYTK